MQPELLALCRNDEDCEHGNDAGKQPMWHYWEFGLELTGLFTCLILKHFLVCATDCHHTAGQLHCSS